MKMFEPSKPLHHTLKKVSASSSLGASVNLYMLYQHGKTDHPCFGTLRVTPLGNRIMPSPKPKFIQSHCNFVNQISTSVSVAKDCSDYGVVPGKPSNLNKTHPPRGADMAGNGFSVQRIPGTNQTCTPVSLETADLLFPWKA